MDNAYLSSSSRTESSGTDLGTHLKKDRRRQSTNSYSQNDPDLDPISISKLAADDVLLLKKKSSGSKRHSSSKPTSRTKDPTKTHSLSSTAPTTLKKLLQAQESTTKETRALLNAALAQLDAASARAAKAEAQMREREAFAMHSYAQLTQEAAKAEEAATRARREAEAYKFQLSLRDGEVRREKERVQAEERMRSEAEKEAQRARTLARKWREEGRIMKAKENGRKLGYGEGLERGRLVIAATIAAKKEANRGLVGDGAAYIEEFHDDSEYQPHRTDYSRSRATRSRRSEPTSRRTHQAPASRRELESFSTRPSESEPAGEPFSESVHSPSPPPPPLEILPPPPPEPDPPSQALTLYRARSIQTDPVLFQFDRTRSLRTTSTTSSAHSGAQSGRQEPTPPRNFVQTPSSPHQAPYFEESYNPERQSIKSEPFSPQIHLPDPLPVPIPTPISQVPFAPGIDPRYASYAPPPPPPQEPVPQPQPSYFPMPAPPVTIVLTPPIPEDERGVQTPSTTTNETSNDIFHGLRGFPNLASRAGSATSSSSASRYERGGGGGFDPDLSTIHEHSREGTAYGEEEEFGPNGAFSPERSRNVDYWRRSLHGSYPGQVGSAGDSDLLQPPSATSRRRPSSSQHDTQSLNRQLSSGSTSSRSIDINIEPPSQSTSPTPHDYQSQGYSDNPQNDAFLSPHHAAIALTPDPEDDVPVLPREEYEDEEEDEDEPQASAESAMYPIPIVNAFPPGFVPTPNGTRIMQLRPDGGGIIAGAGTVAGAATGGVPIGFYGSNANTNSHHRGHYPYVVANVRDDHGDRSGSSSRSSSVSGSSTSTELERPVKYSRNGHRADNGVGLTSTFPPSYMADSAADAGSGRGTPGAGYATLGGIYSVPTRSALKNVTANMSMPSVPHHYESAAPAAAAYYQNGGYPPVVGGTSRQIPAAVSFPEASVPQYQSTDPPTKRRSLRRVAGSVAASQYESQGSGGSRITAPAINMPDVSVPEYSTYYQNQPNGGGGSYMTEPSFPVPRPDASGPQYSQSYQTPGTSRMTTAALPMPEASVPNSIGSAGTHANDASYMTSPVLSFPELNSQQVRAPGSSKMTNATLPMPEPLVRDRTGEASRRTPANRASYGHGTSRVTSANVPMPEASVPNLLDEAESRRTTPGSRSSYVRGTSGMTNTTIPMPEAPVSRLAEPHHHPTPGNRGSYMSSPVLSFPHPGSQDSAPGSSRMTPAALPMPEASVLNPTREAETRRTPRSRASQDRGTSRMTNATIPMPEASVPNFTEPHQYQTPGTRASYISSPVISFPHPSSQDSQAPGTSRITPASLPMPEAVIPNLAETDPWETDPWVPPTVPGTSRITPASLPMPEASVPSFAASPRASPLQTPGGETSRMIPPVIPMPEPGTTSAGGSSRMTEPAIDMPEPEVSGKALSKAQKLKKKMKKNQKNISFPEPEVEEEEEDFGGGTSSRIPGAFNATSMPPSPAPAMTMPIPTVEGSPLPTNSNLSQPFSSPNSGWGLSANAWGGTNETPNRASLHAGITPVAMPEPLPVVPAPVPGPAVIPAGTSKGNKKKGKKSAWGA